MKRLHTLQNHLAGRPLANMPSPAGVPPDGFIAGAGSPACGAPAAVARIYTGAVIGLGWMGLLYDLAERVAVDGTYNPNKEDVRPARVVLQPLQCPSAQVPRHPTHRCQLIGW